VAVVQRSKDKLWVLPRGKLRRDERPIRGAKREVVEETGFRVEVCQFLGVLTYQARSGPKVVQFWLMQAEAEPSYEVMKDIVAVEWLPLAAAVRRLSHPLEKLFLTNVGRHAIQSGGPQRRGKMKIAKGGSQRRNSTRH
jgi:8-oxo-dGTP diphosphatase